MHVKAGPGKARFHESNVAGRCGAGLGVACQGEVLRINLGKARQGTARHGTARRGKAWQGQARQGFSVEIRNGARYRFGRMPADSSRGQVRI